MLTARFKYLDLKPGDKVLDLGCGEGRHVHGLHMVGGLDVIGVDLDETSLEKAREGLATLPPQAEGETRLQRGDATALDFPDATFDAVICSEVLEHLPDYGAVLREIRRVLKPVWKIMRFGPSWLARTSLLAIGAAAEWLRFLNPADIFESLMK